MDEALDKKEYKTATDQLSKAEGSSPAGDLTPQNESATEGLQRLSYLVNSLMEQDNNLTKRFELFDSLVVSLKNQIAELANKLNQINPLIKATEKSSLETDNERLEHLDSLVKFAEKTIVEADKQAVLIKMEVAEKASAAATSIISEAKERAKAEAEKISSNMERKAEQNAKEKVTAAEQKAQYILKQAEDKAWEKTSTANQEADRIISEAKRNAIKIGQQTQQTLKPMGEEPEVVKIAANQEASRTVDEAKKNGENGLYTGTIELAIPPPVGLERMLQLHKHLKQTPKIEVLNLGGSIEKGITIRLRLESPVTLIKILEELPEVKKASGEMEEAARLVPSRQGGDESSVQRIMVFTRE